jgi:hypothetical protein
MLEMVDFNRGPQPIPRYNKVGAAQNRIKHYYDVCLKDVGFLERDREFDRKAAKGETNTAKPANYMPQKQWNRLIAQQAKKTKALIAPQRELLATPQAARELPPEKIEEMLKFLETLEPELEKLEKL